MRAALEGVAFSLRQGLEAIAKAGVVAKELSLAGGGTLETAWKQLLADVLRIPLYTSTVASASARGAAILAGIGIGVLDANAAMEFSALPSLATTPEPFEPALEEAWIRSKSLYPQLHQWQLPKY